MKLHNFHSHVLALLLATLPLGLTLAGQVNSQDGDLFLGFRATDGTGETQDYLVDLGPAIHFKSSTGFTVTGVGNIGADLATVFGSDWYTRLDSGTGTNAVLYGVIGAQEFNAGTGDPDNTIYASNPDFLGWPRRSNSQQSIISGLIGQMAQTFNFSDATANSNVATIQDAAMSGSYADFQPGGSQSGGISFQAYGPSIEGTPNQILYLDRVTPENPAVDRGEPLGFFQLSPEGTLTYAPASQPTPTVTPTPSATVTPTPTASATPTVTPSAVPTVTPTAIPLPQSHLGNISTRLAVKTGDKVLIGGFIITGSQPKKVIVRAIGPSLPLAGSLPDPILDLYNSAGQLLVSNDNWMDAPNRQDIIKSTMPPGNTLESAILLTLDPGPYTALVRGANNSTGIALVEVYDLDSTVDSKLGNISARGFVDAGANVMIGGFIMRGTDAQRVLVRAIGPSLPLPGRLSDTLLELHDSNGALLASNDNWRDTQAVEISATGIPPLADTESAIVETLSPGAYTAVVRGKNGHTGVALVEVYGLGP